MSEQDESVHISRKLWIDFKFCVGIYWYSVPVLVFIYWCLLVVFHVHEITRTLRQVCKRNRTWPLCIYYVSKHGQFKGYCKYHVVNTFNPSIMQGFNFQLLHKMECVLSVCP